MRRALIIGLVVLAGCGSGAATTATSTTTTTRPSTTTTAPATTTTSPSTAPPTTRITTTTVAAHGPTIADLLALGRPVVLAHTGGEDEFPGSTMYSYGESVKAGVDMLDLNVMLTKDGVLVIQHDGTVDRQTNGTGKVADMTYAELSKLDNAYWFTPDGVGKDHPTDRYVYRGIRTGERPPPAGYTADDFAIPRFGDLIARYPTMPLNIEIEGSGEAAAAAARQLATELRAANRLDASVVASFDDATVTLLPPARAVGGHVARLRRQRGVHPRRHAAAGRHAHPPAAAGDLGSAGAHAGEHRQVARRRLPDLGVAERSVAGEPGGLRPTSSSKGSTG